jgi:hypothetical protein
MSYSQLLTALDFSADPFSACNADKEKNLVSYFIEPPFYEAVLGSTLEPASSIVFAPRGGGKTALKCKIEFASRHLNIHCVTYNHFPSPAAGQSRGSIEYHLSNIIPLVLMAILFDVDAKGKAHLEPPEQRLLYFLCQHHLQHLHLGTNAIKSIKSFETKFIETWNVLRKPANLLAHVGSLCAGSVTEMTEFGPLTEQAPKLGTLKEQLEFCVTVSRKFGRDAVYVLVDRVDETNFTNTASSAYAFIASLVEEVSLLEMEGFAVKFFLGDMLQPFYSKNGRPDRIKYYNLEWSNHQLQQMLTARLRAHAAKKEITHLWQLLEEDQKSTKIDEIIVNLSSHSPRTVIRICKEIFDQQSNISCRHPFLSIEAIERGLDNFAVTYTRDHLTKDIRGDLRQFCRSTNQVTFTTKTLCASGLTRPMCERRIQQWEQRGIIERIGQRRHGTRPSKLYGFRDPLIARFACRHIGVLPFIRTKLRRCPDCGSLLIRDYDQEPNADFHICDEERSAA